MKKILFILILVISISSCKNFDKDHPDYAYTSGYFPYQYPVRTLVLGDYIYDNSNDNAHKFVISVAMGGVYVNDKNRVFDIKVDNNLCNNLFFTSKGSPVLAMPSNYYSLSSSDKITIPAGKVNGGVDVQLSDAFFNDPLAFTQGYAVPVRLLGSTDVDTILSGSTSKSNPDPRIASDWAISPKNFTVFAVKYINEFHGTYFRGGKSSVKNASGAVVENTTYSESYVEKNPVTKLKTVGRYMVSYNTVFESKILKGNIGLILTFNGNNCTVSAAAGSSYTVSGTGEFLSKKYSWGNKDRDGIVLKYTVTNGTNTYDAEDTLVIRDRDVVMEVYSPVVE